MTRDEFLDMHCSNCAGEHESCQLRADLDALLASELSRRIAALMVEHREALADAIKAFDDSREGRGWDNAAVDAVRALAKP